MNKNSLCRGLSSAHWSLVAWKLRLRFGGLELKATLTRDQFALEESSQGFYFIAEGIQSSTHLKGSPSSTLHFPCSPDHVQH